MWKAESRHTYDRKGLRYPTDLTDAEWELARPFIEVPQLGPRRRRRLIQLLRAVSSTRCARAGSQIHTALQPSRLRAGPEKS